MDRIFLAEVIGLVIMIVILIIPGIYAVGLLSHELYHYMQHSNYTQAFCVSVGNDSPAFVIVNHTSDIDQFDYEQEEKEAHRFSAIVTWFYTFIFLCTMIWLIIILIENRKIKINK